MKKADNNETSFKFEHYDNNRKLINTTNRKKDLNDLHTGDIIISPTSNCQLSSISDFGFTMKWITNKKTFMLFMRELSKCSRNIILIDVRVDNEEDEIYDDPFTVNDELNYKRLCKYLKPNSIIKQIPYTSTNNSNMCMFLIDMRCYKPKIKNKPSIIRLRNRRTRSVK